VLGVVSDRRIGGSAVGSAFVIDREAGEIAVVPGLAAVGGSGETNISTAPADAAGPAGHVERGHNGVAPGEHIGLDFGLVIAVSVSEIVDTDSGQVGLSGSRSRERERKSENQREHKHVLCAKEAGQFHGKYPQVLLFKCGNSIARRGKRIVAARGENPSRAL
jgi:hypothetical protein